MGLIHALAAADVVLRDQETNTGMAGAIALAVLASASSGTCCGSPFGLPQVKQQVNNGSSNCFNLSTLLRSRTSKRAGQTAPGSPGSCRRSRESRPPKPGQHGPLQVRRYTSWCPHTTLSMLAHAFLTAVRAKSGRRNRTRKAHSDLPARDPAPHHPHDHPLAGPTSRPGLRPRPFTLAPNGSNG